MQNNVKIKLNSQTVAGRQGRTMLLKKGETDYLKKNILYINEKRVNNIFEVNH